MVVVLSGGTSGKVLMETLTSQSGGSPGSSLRNTFGNSFTIKISFSPISSFLEFNTYARYLVHPFLNNFLLLTAEIRLVGIIVLSPLKIILLPHNP